MERQRTRERNQQGERSTAAPLPLAVPLTVQLEVTWLGNVVELVTIPCSGRLRHRLRSGHELKLVPIGEGWTLSIDDESMALGSGGPAVEFAGQLSAQLITLKRAPQAKWRWRVDTRFIHAALIAAALQIGGVSALLLTPAMHDDPGAGYRIDQLRHYLRAPSGAAEKKGPGAVVRVGRRAEEAERPVVAPPARGIARAVPRLERVRQPAQSLAAAIEALERVVQGGSPIGAELRQTIGDLARSTANAPTEAAGFGGLLRPRNAIDVGAGSGIIGIGSNRIRELTQQRRRLDDTRPPPPELTKTVHLIPEAKGNGEVTQETDDGFELDTIVRDHLAKAVRRRQSNIRYCYVTWGLQTDPTRTGRVVLELTLRPDGYVSAPEAKHSDPTLGLVADCIERMAKDWYLGHGLVEEDQRMAFPFILQPRVQSIHTDPHTIEALRVREP